MSGVIPPYYPPDFTLPPLLGTPPVRTEPAPMDGVVPERFHGTSNHPEYVHLGEGRWLLAAESRMDCVMVLEGETLRVVEPRLVRAAPLARIRPDLEFKPSTRTALT